MRSSYHKLDAYSPFSSPNAVSESGKKAFKNRFAPKEEIRDSYRKGLQEENGWNSQLKLSERSMRNLPLRQIYRRGLFLAE
ncbi:hypothetical protein Q3G72_015082 [Acer saccharum]|nr:hypothetical protein Q3G72_003419 [Acer saccharum]KAK1567673.1 hypothetical protein Q3G72_015082 [Acer saccharum]